MKNIPGGHNLFVPDQVSIIDFSLHIICTVRAYSTIFPELGERTHFWATGYRPKIDAGRGRECKNWGTAAGGARKISLEFATNQKPQSSAFKKIVSQACHNLTPFKTKTLYNLSQKHCHLSHSSPILRRNAIFWFRGSFFVFERVTESRT